MFEMLFFDFFAILALISACVVIFSSQPIKSVLSLIFAFFLSALLWMILKAEFLSLSLIFVYIGAVMTLFVFMVMMINLESLEKTISSSSLIISGIFMSIFIMTFFAYYLKLSVLDTSVTTSDYYGSTKEIGDHLYTSYFAVFQLIGVILLTSVVGSLFLVKRLIRAQKTQDVKKQIDANKSDRLTVVDLRSENGTD